MGTAIGAVEALCEDLLVATRGGQILLVTPRGAVQHLGGDIPMNRAAFRAHPDFTDRRYHRLRVNDILLQPQASGRWRVLATHHYFAQECIRFRLSVTSAVREGGKVVLSPDWRTVLDAEPCLPTDYNGGQNAGGKMVPDGPGHVFVAIGDHEWDGSDDWPAMNAPWELNSPQSAHSHFGKLLRIAIETGETETVAVGLRNPQGLAADRQGNLWEVEHGPQGGDELNLMLRGGNYGWPFVSYGVGYGGKVAGHDTVLVLRHEKYAKPVFAWVPSVATTAVVVNDETSFPLWSDDLLVASLSGSLYRVRHDGGSVRYVEEIDVGAAEIGVDVPRIRDLTQTSDGRIVLTSVRRLTTLRPFATGCDVEWRLVRHIHSLPCDE